MTSLKGPAYRRMIGMITRRRFIGLLAAILPAAMVPIKPMETKAPIPQPKSGKGIKERFFIDPGHERYSHMLDAYQYTAWRTKELSEKQFRRLYPASRVKFDTVNYGTVAFRSNLQRDYNLHRSKVLDIIGRKL